MLKTTEKSYKKCLTAWGAEINSREIDYDPEEMKRQLASGLKLQKIARNFGVCDNTLHKWRKAHGCPLQAPKRQITPELFQTFEELYQQGYRDIEIARKTTHSSMTVQKWRESRGYPQNKTPTRIIFERTYGEGCRNYSTLAEATGLSEPTMRTWVNKEIRKEAKVSEDPKVYYRKARAKLKELNSNKVHRRLPRYRTCTIILNTADAQVPKNQAWHPTVNLANLLGVPEPEITDKDAVQAPKIEAIVQELEAMMKECRSKSKAELDTAYQGDGAKTPGKLQKALK